MFSVTKCEKGLISVVRIEAADNNGGRKATFLIPELDECPICHYALKPTVLEQRYVLDSSNGDCPLGNLYVTFFCHKCRKVFLGRFLQDISTDYPLRADYLGKYELFPETPNFEAFSKGISELSPTFVETYRQAQQAEAEKLSQICGVGYRKSLEYLVKDYLCHKFPGDEDDIKTEALGRSLQRVEDARIKTLAQRATWIGNDETHYVRKHEDLDIGTMKTFIQAMVHFVDSELTFEQALEIAPA